MKFLEIAGKFANIENIRYITHRIDKNTGKVYCLYVFDRETVLEEVFENSEAFKEALRRFEIFDNTNISKSFFQRFLRLPALLLRFFSKRK